MHIYPLRCCLDSLYVVGAVNNGARLRKLPILIRNRIDAIFRHRPLQRSHTCRKHRNPRFGSASNRPTIAMGVITATCGGIAGHICSRCDRHHLGRRPHPERLAVDRGDARLHRVRAREMGRAGQAARSRGLAIGPGGREGFAVNAAQGAAAATGQDAVAGLEWQPSVTGGLCKLLQECRKTFREGLFF
jgi:hypothetical protein